MKSKLRLRLSLILFVLIALLVVAACKRSEQRVEAAREETAPAREETTPAVDIDRDAPLSMAERDFITWAAGFHTTQRVLSQFALQRSTNEDVRTFAQQVVDDDLKAFQELAGLMQKHGVNEPITVQEARRSLSRLEPLSGPAFDREFGNIMVESNREALDTYLVQSNAAQHADIRRYASHFVPTLMNHMKQAEQLQRDISTRLSQSASK
jgi:putative membrane protein